MENSTEFLNLLERVVEDGELTYNEILEIAKWMNENKSGRKLWPVNLFYDLLKRVFADGKIDKNEAREVANLIQSVRRDWIRKNMVVAPPVVGSPTGVTPPNVAPPVAGSPVFSIEQAKLPTIPIQVLVRSSSEADTEYSVDLLGPTCTCPDFVPRSKLPKGDLSRCCKHVFQAFAQVRPKDGWTGWLDSFLELGIRPNPKTKWAVVKLGEDFVLISSAPQDWANVYLHSGLENERFGYSVVEERWAYGKAPEYPAKIVAAICKLDAGT
jgi:hypothetical protein